MKSQHTKQAHLQTTQADTQTKALSKSLQSQRKRKEILKNAPPHDKRQ